MRKKEIWMIKGSPVLALGKRGLITGMQENTINGIDYVYYIDVRLDGEKSSGRYHPSDIDYARNGITADHVIIDEVKK